MTKQQQLTKQQQVTPKQKVLIVRELAITANNHHMMAAQTCKFIIIIIYARLLGFRFTRSVSLWNPVGIIYYEEYYIMGLTQVDKFSMLHCRKVSVQE